MKVRIRLDTASEIANFVLATNSVKEAVYVTDDGRLCIDGKSFLGLAHAKEFSVLYCECERDIYTKIKDFVVEED